MSSPLTETGWTGVAGAVLVALVGLVSTVVTVRAGRRAGSEQQSLEQGAISVQSVMDIVSGYEVRLRSLEEAAKKTAHDLDGMHSWKRAAIRYIRALREHGLRHSPEESLPDPPLELIHDLRED